MADERHQGPVRPLMKYKIWYREPDVDVHPGTVITFFEARRAITGFLLFEVDEEAFIDLDYDNLGEAIVEAIDHWEEQNARN